MDSEKKINELWFEYIIKLNDRILKKHRYSGFTTWAICGLLCFLFYRILDQIPAIINSKEIQFLTIVTTTNLINIFKALVSIIHPLLINAYQPSTFRLTSKLDKTSAILTTIPIKIFISFSSLINFFVAFYIAKSVLISWPFFFFGIIYILELFWPLLQRILYKRKFREKNLPVLNPTAIFTGPNKKPYIIGSFIGAIIFFFVSIYSWSNFILNTNILSHIDTIKVSIEIFACLLLIIYICMRISSLMTLHFLEKLERKILIDELDTNQIKSIFIKEFLGETTREWINNIWSQINDSYDKFLEEIANAHKKLDQIKSINKEYIIEIKGRRDKICNSVKEVFDNYANLNEKYLDYIFYLINQGAFVHTDNEFLKHIIKIWKTQSSEIRSAYDKFCCTCKSIDHESKIKDICNGKENAEPNDGADA